jgi:Type II secretion system (T2SS), protein F
VGDRPHGAIGDRVSPLWSGLLAAWIVLRLAGIRRHGPWQVADLDVGGPATIDTDESPDDPGPGPVGTNRRIPSVPTRSRRERRVQREVEADLPITVDLLHVAVTAGHSLHGAVAAVGGSGSGRVSAAFARADRRFRHGSRLVDELDALAVDLGPSVRPLSTTLVVAASSGAPLGPPLQRLADAERRRLRRRTEERVRRLPVLLLGPLVGLVLPAFVLLTVVPVAITTARTGLLPAAGASATASVSDGGAASVPAAMTLPPD